MCKEKQNEEAMELIESLRKETGFDEVVIGCFLSNYKIPYLCPVATPVGYCKEATKCTTLCGLRCKTNEV